MAKTIMLFSGGKESLSVYYKLVDELGVTNVYPVYLKGITRNAARTLNQKWILDNVLPTLPNAKAVNIANKSYYEFTKDIFKDIPDVQNCYLSSGDFLRLEVLSPLFKTIKAGGLKGYYSPFATNYKAKIFHNLKQKNCQFLIHGCNLPYNTPDHIVERVLDTVGQVYTTEQLLQLRDEYPNVFTLIQTTVVKSDDMNTTADQIKTFASEINKAKVKEHTFDTAEK